MRFLLSGHRVRIGIGALSLLLIQALYAPRPAWAGCTYPATSSAQRASSLASLDELITGGNPSAMQGHRPDPRRPAPCSGASCSGRVPLPVSTAATGVADPDQWVALGRTVDLARSSGGIDRDDDEDPYLGGSPLPIFHPPRSSS